MSASGLGRVYTRTDSRFFWIEISVSGKPYRESSRSTRQQDAESLLAKRIAEFRLQPGVLVKRTVSQIVDDYLEDADLRGVKCLQQIAHAGELVKELCGHQLARDIDTGRLKDFQKWLRGKGYAPGTINTKLRCFLAMLNEAHRNGYILHSPRAPRRLHEAGPRRGFLEHADYVTISEKLPPWARDVFAFLYYSGWRRNEALGLTWDEVDFAGGVIRLSRERDKTGETRLLPIVAGIAEIIERRRAVRVVGLPFLFHKHGARFGPGQYRIYPHAINAAFREACIAAGRPKILLHDCRRSATRNLVRSGVPEAIAMRVTGHKSRAIFTRYNIVAENELADAVSKMGEYLERKASEASARGEVVNFRKPGEGT